MIAQLHATRRVGSGEIETKLEAGIGVRHEPYLQAPRCYVRLHSLLPCSMDRATTTAPRASLSSVPNRPNPRIKATTTPTMPTIAMAMTTTMTPAMQHLDVPCVTATDYALSAESARTLCSSTTLNASCSTSTCEPTSTSTSTSLDRSDPTRSMLASSFACCNRPSPVPSQPIQ